MAASVTGFDTEESILAVRSYGGRELYLESTFAIEATVEHAKSRREALEALKAKVEEELTQ